MDYTYTKAKMCMHICSYTKRSRKHTNLCKTHLQRLRNEGRGDSGSCSGRVVLFVVWLNWNLTAAAISELRWYCSTQKGSNCVWTLLDRGVQGTTWSHGEPCCKRAQNFHYEIEKNSRLVNQSGLFLEAWRRNILKLAKCHSLGVRERKKSPVAVHTCWKLSPRRNS